jgi:hypothetical protein
MIFEAEMLTALAAEFVTMVSSFRPPPEGCSRLPPLAGLLARGSDAFFRLPGFLQWLGGKAAALEKDFPLTVAGAAAGLTKNPSHRIPSKPFRAP